MIFCTIQCMWKVHDVYQRTRHVKVHCRYDICLEVVHKVHLKTWNLKTQKPSLINHSLVSRGFCTVPLHNFQNGGQTKCVQCKCQPSYPLLWDIGSALNKNWSVYLFIISMNYIDNEFLFTISVNYIDDKL